jgi:hypothetical protein
MQAMEGYFKVNVKELESEDMAWIHLVQGWVQLWALVNSVMNFQVP